MPRKLAPAHIIHMAPVSVTQEHDDWLHERAYLGIYTGLKLATKCDRGYMIWKAFSRFANPSTYCYEDMHRRFNFKSLLTKLTNTKTGIKRIEHMIAVNHSNNKYIEGVKYFDQYDMHCALMETHLFHLEHAMKLINQEYPHTYKPIDAPQISSYQCQIRDFEREWKKVNFATFCFDNGCKSCSGMSYKNKEITKKFNEFHKPIVEKMSPMLKSYDIIIKWRFWARVLNNNLRLSSMPKIKWDRIVFNDVYKQQVAVYNSQYNQ